MKKILITGSHGFLGRNISKILSKKSFIVYGIGNGNWSKNYYKKWGFDYLLNGEVNLKNLCKNFKNFDYIIHCAGSGKIGLPYKKDFNKNVNSIKSVLEFIKHTSPKSKVIYLSSYSVYGEYGVNGDLVLSSFHYGSDVEDFWGNDEYEYYFVVDKENLPKFFLNCLSKGFNSEEKFTLHDLQKICDKEGIKYSTNTWV